MVLVIGTAITPFNRRKDATAPADWAGQAFDAALRMADLDRSDLDALIVSSESDFFSLQLNPASVLAGHLGLVGAQTMRVEGGGASGQLAVHAAVDRILTGRARFVAVLGVDPSASALGGDSIRKLYGYSFDFWTDGLTGATASALYALSWQAYAAGGGNTEAALNTVVTKNRGNAMRNPNAHLPRIHTTDDFDTSPMIASPYRRLHCSPLSDGAAVLILSAQDAAPQARQRVAPRISGIGAASDQPGLGHRKTPGHFTAKTSAARQALNMAGIQIDAVDTAEVYDAYAGSEVQAIDALGLSSAPLDDLADGVFHRDGARPINLSGGLLGQGAPVGATGVTQTATCAQLLEGRYHAELQPGRPLRHALADTHGGVGTTCAVTVLSAGAGV